MLPLLVYDVQYRRAIDIIHHLPQIVVEQHGVLLEGHCGTERAFPIVGAFYHPQGLVRPHKHGVIERDLQKSVIAKPSRRRFRGRPDLAGHVLEYPAVRTLASSWLLEEFHDLCVVALLSSGIV